MVLQNDILQGIALSIFMLYTFSWYNSSEEHAHEGNKSSEAEIPAH